MSIEKNTAIFSKPIHFFDKLKLGIIQLTFWGLHHLVFAQKTIGVSLVKDFLTY